MRSLCDALVLILTLFFSLSAKTQEIPLLGRSAWSPAQIATFDNVDKLQAEISIPRRVFLVNELFSISIAVHNPTSEDLVVPDPFRGDTGGLTMEERGNDHARQLGLEYGRVSPTFFGVVPSAPTIMLHAGQTLTRQCWLDKRNCLFDAAYPRSVGDYRISFNYGNAPPVVFSLRKSVLIHRLALLSISPVPGDADPRLRRVAVFSANVDDEWWLFLTRPVRQQTSVSRLPALHAQGALRTTGIMPFWRLSPIPVEPSSLSIVVSEKGTLFVDCSLVNGETLRFVVSPETGEVLR